MRTYSAWLAVLVTACTTSSPSASAAPGAGSATSAPPVPAPVAPGPAPARSATGAGEGAEVVHAAEKTAAGGSVFMVGLPRFQLAVPDGIGPLVLRTRRGTVIAEDAHAISLWNAANGAPLQRIAPGPEVTAWAAVSLAVSDDGEWLATGSSRVRVFRAPFDKPVNELACYEARAFSHDAKLLACATNVMGIWDIAQRRLVAPLPASAPKDLVRAVRFAADDRSLVWATDRAVLRWEFAGTGAVTPIYQAPARIEYATIAAGGSVAYVSMAGKKAAVVDLVTGKATNAPADFGVAMSPSGKRLAMELTAALQVIDVATGKATWTAKVTAPVTRIAFGETDDALVYVEAGRLRVATLPAAPIAPAQTARFVGWLGGGVAAIERGDTVRAFALATGTWAPADRAALTPKPLDGAPAWARWVAEAPGGPVAAEPSKRHELAPDRRGVEPCTPKLRVWTPAGGTKTLAMTCTKAELDDHEDPGWDIGGGWAVGVSATTAAIYDSRTGRRIGAIEVQRRKAKKPEFSPAYWQMALAPAGDWLALVWRRAELQGASGTEPSDPREDAMHVDETAVSADCVSGERGCQLEYFAGLWSIKGTPKRVWQGRIERSRAGNEPAELATPTGVLAFDRSGEHLFIGLDDGEIRIISTATPGEIRSEHLHRVAIRALSIDPSDSWVFSADAAGEQRIWKLRP